MKNGLFFTILLFLTVSSFAQDIRNRFLFLEGSSARMDHLDFFKRSFTMEANGTGYVITNTMAEALHTLRFRVASNNVYDPVLEMDTEQYVITMSLHRNSDSSTLVTFDFSFTSIDETYPFLRTLFLNSVTPIPLPLLTEENFALVQGNHWNKWIYFRASFDYPITFYLLKPDGLEGGIGLTGPGGVSPIDHVIRAMPGATVGVEFQLLNFLNIELNFQASMGDTRNNKFINMAAGAELKFPIKFRNVMLLPYGAFTYPVAVSDIFSEFPLFSVGGGFQFCARAGKRGIFFLDVQYMFSLTDAVMHNPWLALPPGEQMYPDPAVIHYKRSYLGVGIGYKIGIIDKKKNTATIIY